MQLLQACIILIVCPMARLVGVRKGVFFVYADGGYQLLEALPPPSWLLYGSSSVPYTNRDRVIVRV